MSKSIAHCSVEGRGYTQWEYDCLPMNAQYQRVCKCHNLPVKIIGETVSEKLHEMIASHNATPEKTFYYTENETMELCKQASRTWIPADTFDVWWDLRKKK